MYANTVKSEPCSAELRVLAIFGSPKSDGVTSRLFNSFLDALPDYAVKEIYNCYKKMPHPCTDCRFCYSENRCFIPDLDDFYNKLELANVLIFATPVYNMSFPAPLKALIDRMQRYWAARFVRNMRPPILKKKRVVLITACGTDNIEGGKMLERQLKPVLTILNSDLTKVIHYFGSDKDKPLEPSIITCKTAAQSLGEK